MACVTLELDASRRNSSDSQVTLSRAAEQRELAMARIAAAILSARLADSGVDSSLVRRVTAPAG